MLYGAYATASPNLDLEKNSWFENERGRRRPVPFGSRSGLASSSYFFGFFLCLFLPHRSGVGHLVCETFLCAVAEACITLRLREEKSGCGTHPTLLSLVTCTRQLYPSTRRRVSSATLRADPRFLPELLLHSPLAEKGQ